MKILLTGASGVMGLATLKMLKGQDIRAFCLDVSSELKKLKPYERHIEIFKGDASVYDDIYRSLEGVDIVLHLASIIPPQSEKSSMLTFKVNYGSSKNIVDAIIARGMADTCKLVYISSVALYGDRQYPIHWGRVGDPIKVSFGDYYGLSKVASERYIIESKIKHWAILRQTGIISAEMLSHRSSLIFHQPLINVLEYISDRDSARLMKEIIFNAKETFWQNIYNIGGGKGLRLPAFKLYKRAFNNLGFKNYENILDPRLFAIRNFHGMYYLDSNKLNDMFHYVHDDVSYIDECTDKYTKGFSGVLRAIMKFAPIQALAKYIIKKQFRVLSLHEHGPLSAVATDDKLNIAKFFINKERWNKIDKIFVEPSIDYTKQIKIEHGYDDSKPDRDIDIDDVKAVERYRGGKLLSDYMQKGDLSTKLRFCCAEGHEFDASPRLILRGGYWCPKCEMHEWKPAYIADKNPFFAQVWDPLHSKAEKPLVISKNKF